MKKKAMRDLDLKGKRVLVRVDFNVPLKDGQVSDHTRIRAAVPTLEYLLAQPAAVILCSHLARPDGQPNSAYSLKPVADKLQTMLPGREVSFASDCVGKLAIRTAAALRPGNVLLLENTRFYSEEKQNDNQFSRNLANLADVFINDAFGSAHRSHASTVGVAQYMPAAAGLLMEKELDFLGRAVSRPERPFVAILGGAKVTDKIGVIRSLLGMADTVLIGGGMANTFLKSKGMNVASSFVEDGAVEIAGALLQEYGDRLVLPTELVIANRFNEDADTRIIGASDRVPVRWSILDIGPGTIEQFAVHVRDAQMIVWNGPMGVTELRAFSVGTNALARLVANSRATTIIGGGDSVAAVRRAGLADEITHISTGGGATLEFLQGNKLPGVVALDDC